MQYLQLLKSNYNIKGNETLSKERLQAMADFYRNRMYKIHNEQPAVLYDLYVLNKQVSEINNLVVQRQSRNKPYVGPFLSGKETQLKKNSFDLLYYIPNAGWQLTYDLMAGKNQTPKTYSQSRGTPEFPARLGKYKAGYQ